MWKVAGENFTQAQENRESKHLYLYLKKKERKKTQSLVYYVQHPS